MNLADEIAWLEPVATEFRKVRLLVLVAAMGLIAAAVPLGHSAITTAAERGVSSVFLAHDLGHNPIIGG